MRRHLPSFWEVKSRSDKICPVEPGRHSVKAGREQKVFRDVSPSVAVPFYYYVIQMLYQNEPLLLQGYSVIM